MYADRLKLLLSEGGITPDNVRAIAALCDEWFTTGRTWSGYSAIVLLPHDRRRRRQPPQVIFSLERVGIIGAGRCAFQPSVRTLDRGCAGCRRHASTRLDPSGQPRW